MVLGSHHLVWFGRLGNLECFRGPGLDMENSIRLFKHLRHFFKKGKGEKLPMVSHHSNNITFNIFNILVLSFSLFFKCRIFACFSLRKSCLYSAYAYGSFQLASNCAERLLHIFHKMTFCKSLNTVVLL